MRAEAIPPSSGSSGDASLRKRRTASVGNENGSASRIAPAAPSRSGSPDSAPEPSSISSTVAWNGSTSPSPSDAAQTETAVPSSTSRASEITPPAPQPTSVIGRASRGRPRASPRAPRDARRRRTRRRGRTARPLSPRAAAEAASSAPARASGVVDSPVAMCTLTHLTILRGHARDRDLRADRRRQDRGRDRARRPAPRATARTPSRSPPTRCRSTTGSPILTGAATPEQQSAPRAPPARRRAGRRSPSAPAPTPPLAHAEIDGALAAGRRPIVVGGTGLYLRAALAAARPAPAGPRGPRAAAGAAHRVRAGGAARRAGPARARGRRGHRALRRPPDRARARAARRRDRAAALRRRRLAAVDDRHPPPDAAGRPGDGARGAAGAHRPPCRRDGRRGRRRGGPARRRAGRVEHRPQGARLRRSCSPATSRR